MTDRPDPWTESDPPFVSGTGRYVAGPGDARRIRWEDMTPDEQRWLVEVRRRMVADGTLPPDTPLEGW